MSLFGHHFPGRRSLESWSHHVMSIVGFSNSFVQSSSSHLSPSHSLSLSISLFLISRLCLFYSLVVSIYFYLARSSTISIFNPFFQDPFSCLFLCHPFLFSFLFPSRLMRLIYIIRVCSLSHVRSVEVSMYANPHHISKRIRCTN
jgi:hypothetical protein